MMLLTTVLIALVSLICLVIAQDGDVSQEVSSQYRYPNFHRTAPPIYWINLDSDEARRIAFTKHLKKLGVKNHKRISAIKFDGTSEYKVEADDVFTKKFGWDMRLEPCTIKEFSVTVTHILAIRAAVENAEAMGHKYAMILEDDVSFSFDIDFEELIKSAPADFSILQLETCNINIVRPQWDRYIRKLKANKKNTKNPLPPYWQKHIYDRKSALSWVS